MEKRHKTLPLVNLTTVRLILATTSSSLDEELQKCFKINYRGYMWILLLLDSSRSRGGFLRLVFV